MSPEMPKVFEYSTARQFSKKPLEDTPIDAVAQDLMDRTPLERRHTAARHESRCLSHGCDVLERIVASGIPFEELYHHGCDIGVKFNRSSRHSDL